MARFFKKRVQNKGLAPGSLVFIGEQKIENPLIRVIDFDKEYLEEKELEDIKAGKDYIDKNTVTWLNIDGLHQVDLIKETGKLFGLHPLLLEDLMSTAQRPKFEDFDDYLFFTLKMLYFDKEQEIFRTEQLSMIIGKSYLLTFQERKGDVFSPVRERIRKSKGRIRVSGVDYLAYALLDTVIDNYISIIEKLGDQIEDLEAEIMMSNGKDVSEKIYSLKKELSFLRKSIRPVREAVGALLKTESALIDEKTVPFLKDLNDLIVHTTEAIDTYRDMLADQLNTYNSAISNKMNDIMKVLTIFAAIFIPLTFVAGIYGTNFKYLPELEFRYSYFIFWGILILIAGIMLAYFRRKKWL